MERSRNIYTLLVYPISLISPQSKRVLAWRLNAVGNNKTHLSSRVKCPIIWAILTKFGFIDSFHKISRYQTSGKLSRVRRADSCGQNNRRMNGRTDWYDKPKGAFRDYVTAHKNSISTWQVVKYPHYRDLPVDVLQQRIVGLLCDSHHVQKYSGC